MELLASVTHCSSSGSAPCKQHLYKSEHIVSDTESIHSRMHEMAEKVTHPAILTAQPSC